MKKQLLICALGITSALNASIIISEGNHPQPPEYEILLNNGMTGTEVTGTFNGNAFPGVNAVFTSGQALLEPASGQARVTALTGLLTNVTVSLSGGYTFGDIIFALNRPNGPDGSSATYSIFANGTVTGSTPASTGNLTTGNQFFTIVATGETMRSVSISSSGLDDIRQVRFSLVTPPGGGGGGGGGEVPEPSTLALLGGGTAILALVRKFRKV